MINMNVTEKMVQKLRALNQGNSVKVNGKEYQVADTQILPEPKFELKEEKETKEEGIEIYLAEMGKELDDSPIFSADYRLACVDYNVEYNLVETKKGILDFASEYGHDHMIVHDYDNVLTRVYKSTYTKKDIKEVKIKLLDLDNVVIPLESIEF